MDEVLKQIAALNRNLERIADALSPSVDAKVLAEFTAFRCISRNGTLALKGIPKPDPITFSEIVGIDEIIEELRENTEQFLQGLPCNNVLLYGPRGTGKSSAVKALLNAYAADGLRLIEMARDTLDHIIDIADLIRGRGEKYIIFCDDLSFEEEETSYRHIKTVLEGGLETRPANMLIYATSNRRHLMPERVGENQRDLKAELHPEDTLEEKISLSDRFGLRLGFQHFDFDTYFDIIRNYMRIRKLRMDTVELRRLAMQWSIGHGSYSGRTARQFVDGLEGRLRKKKWKRR